MDIYIGLYEFVTVTVIVHELTFSQIANPEAPDSPVSRQLARQK